MLKKGFCFLLFIIVCLMFVACSSTSVEESSIEELESTLIEESDTSEFVVSDLESVRNAVVQIVATGTFVDANVGTLSNTAGSGTGFLISEDGIAVTNNHVVTGASFLEVYLDGEEEPRNAKVLGVSECSDLAVIQIEGENFSYLEWYDEKISVGLDIYSAGFPLGDPEYTLTKGIISKEEANGDTPWASVESVLEHDATINPGNSGGPLINASGKVVGVNYAGSQGTNQYFAISRDTVLKILDSLAAGDDVYSIGINAVALTSEIAGGFGIWVSSVDPGSPAQKAGIEAGDIIYSLQSFALTTVPTMEEYCKILRSHSADDTINIEVLRISSDEIAVLEGQINGDELSEAGIIPIDGSTADPQSSSQPSSDVYGVNLIQNPSAEEPLLNGKIPHWERLSGAWNRGLEVQAYDGSYHFFAGATDGAYAELCQAIDVSTYAAAIDSGTQNFTLGAYVRSFPGNAFAPADSSQIIVVFVDDNSDALNELSSEEYISTSGWDQFEFNLQPDSKTRSMVICLRSIRYGGLDSDGYFDGLSLIALPPE